MSNAHKISAIVVTYFTGRELIKSIEKLESAQDIHEIILLNNGNPEGFLDELRQIFAHNTKLKIIDGHGNIGFGSACNIGAKQALGDYLLFINPDCYFEQVNLMYMIAKLKEQPNHLMAGCLIKNKDDTSQRGCYRKFITPYTVFTGFNMHDSIPDKEGYVDAISGAFMLIAKYDFEQIGRFDEEYFLHFEDMDLCMKIKQAGGKILFFPQFYVTHLLSTSKVTKLFVEEHKLKSCYYYFHKFFGYSLWTRLVLLLIKIRFLVLFKLFKVQ